MKREIRTQRTEIRTASDTPGMFEAVVVRYGVVDSYDTIFDEGCFTASLEERLPRITWGHDWADVIGQYVDYKDGPDGLTLVGQLDDFEAVPRARQAYAQLKSGTIDQFSVGFHRNPGGTWTDEDNREHFRDCGLDEAALVLAGAVPGTKLVSVRSAQRGLSVVREVPEELVISLGKKIASGEMTYEDATAALHLAAGTVPEVTDPPPAETVTDLDDVFLDDGAEAFLG